jgi:hypothetical protein
MTTEDVTPPAPKRAPWNNARIHGLIKQAEAGSKGLALGDAAELFVPAGTEEPTFIVQIRGRSDRRDAVSFWIWSIRNEGRDACLFWSGNVTSVGGLSLDQQAVLIAGEGVARFGRLMLAVLDVTYDWWEVPSYERPILHELALCAEKDKRAALRKAAV